VICAYHASAVVRPAADDPILNKRFLDLGAQTLLVPYVQSAEEAQMAVKSIHYPPQGIRGVEGLTHARRFGTIDDYASKASNELCLIVQVETAEALENLDEITAVEGVIGPADLAASLGHSGRPESPQVVAVVVSAIRAIRQRGKPAGILTANVDFAQQCMEIGTTFTAVDVDIGLLVKVAIRLKNDIAIPGKALF
jgi:4-hydroxy-2-oxoheptanedioate aldolase